MGSRISLEDRIEQMMDAANGDPVVWVTVKTLLGTGPYAQPNMELWNETLRQSCERYPNMKVYDWASDIDDTWFQTDGTHFTSEGYAQRALLTAEALARAYPAGEDEDDNPDCVIG